MIDDPFKIDWLFDVVFSIERPIQDLLQVCFIKQPAIFADLCSKIRTAPVNFVVMCILHAAHQFFSFSGDGIDHDLITAIVNRVY